MIQKNIFSNKIIFSFGNQFKIFLIYFNNNQFLEKGMLDLVRLEKDE